MGVSTRNYYRNCRVGGRTLYQLTVDNNKIDKVSVYNKCCQLNVVNCQPLKQNYQINEK